MPVKAKRFVLSLFVMLALGLGVTTGIPLLTPSGHGGSARQVAYADGCDDDVPHPPPNIDCATPTATPTATATPIDE